MATVTSVACPSTQGPVGSGMLDKRSIDKGESDTSPTGPGRKRKPSSGGPLQQPSAASKNGTVRQKITRACDSCKVKKTRCTAYSRGLPPEPLPASPDPGESASTVAGSGTSEVGRTFRGSRSHATTTTVTARGPISSNHGYPSQPHGVSLRNSPEPGSTDFEGNYIGPASGVSFINRVWSRLHQDERARIPDALQNESSTNTAVFMFGDKPYSHPQDVDFMLPSFEAAMELVAVYFDFSMVTYRFLHRGSVEKWVKQVYENHISISNLPVGIMVARTAIVLMIFAVSTLHHKEPPPMNGISQSERWYAASKYMLSLESGPPRLETIQVRLIQCLYLLSSSRANECWYSFGTALQLVTALGLHRKSPVKLSKNGCSHFELEVRKRIFWSVYTLDKYLSIMFGRPRLLHDEDIDQEFPGEMNDEDLLEEDPTRRTGSTDSMMIASVLHYRLGRILGETSRQLYSINPLSRDSPLETAARLTSELEKWKESVPPLFNSVRPSSLIPPLCRQSQVLQFAYAHAMIHVTRSFLLNDFTDLSRRPSDPHPMVNAHVQKCISAAEDIMTLVDDLAHQNVFVQSFWFTHYVTFCAILVVYIHIIQQHRQATAPSPTAGSPADAEKLHSLFLLAETCQHYLAEATRKNCPSRRYSIILGELRKEVHRHIGSDDHDSISLAPTVYVDGNIIEQRAIAPSGVDHTVSSQPPSLDFQPISGDVPPTDLSAPLIPVEDAGLLENLEGSIWWAQLDSWALSSFPNDPSAFSF
ncbi:C6 transcription factor [Penicillium brasilianum]|uniref:C6 transcription factor n=1 Tax=Penicillium brasilianum TaxID=104259 RepID=A0A1S9RFP7_PENBI|nr:C6 transcription factor [Penicillium brasilianum]